ncbi:SDR family NAD(P)-dependent oxidoreductase, partial [Candidatus Binatus sp.]|uniref:SDR family NAD(P)-dependent oxidoreductase n=1 Tax=Candidatus Binatus sp. TaxID=2811406 RepID=UPI003CB36A17
MEIKGKVGVITGGSSGIGRATSERLAKEGAAIVVADLDEAGGAETVKRIESAGGRAVFVKADVTKLDDARRMLDTAMSKYGRLDILHNNAGIGVGAPGYPDAPPERWHLVIEIDLQAVILGTGLSAPLMQKNGGGVIINTASMAGLYPHRQDAVYGAAKGGVVNFTHSLASWASERKVRVNCICPGIVDTPMVRRGLELAKQHGVKSWMPSRI